MAEQNGNGQQARQKSQNALVEIKRDTADLVAATVNRLQQNGELVLPQNYAVVNALKSAWLTLQNLRDDSGTLLIYKCAKDSVYNAMLDMVVQGLNPAKKQCYFIGYGDQLVCQRSYFGDEQVARNIRPDVDIYYQVIYEGDELETQIERGRTRVVKHIQKFANINPNKIVGAYCVIEDSAGNIVNSVLMTIDQIRQSWKKSKTYKEGGNSFHNQQPDQACLRTVIRRCCKPVINSSNDSWLLESIQRHDMAEETEFEAEVSEHANGEIIDITDDVDGTDAQPRAGQPADDNAGQADAPAELQAAEAQPAEQPQPKREPAASGAGRQARMPGF